MDGVTDISSLGSELRTLRSSRGRGDHPRIQGHRAQAIHVEGIEKVCSRPRPRYAQRTSDPFEDIRRRPAQGSQILEGNGSIALCEPCT